MGTAGWTIPKPHAAAFPVQGSHLQRYAQRFTAVEINSSFYRPHKPATYARWAGSVPPGFRFAVKIPREITHTQRLVAVAEPLERFLSDVHALGDRLGPLLVQLPPSLQFDAVVARAFFGGLRGRFDGLVVCEPRHLSWFTEMAEALLAQHRIARAAVDPAPVAGAAASGGWPEVLYRRLHGSPRMYYSGYATEYIGAIARQMRDEAACVREQWCIFDNTALGRATHDALALQQDLDPLEKAAVPVPEQPASGGGR